MSLDVSSCLWNQRVRHLATSSNCSGDRGRGSWGYRREEGSYEIHSYWCGWRHRPLELPLSVEYWKDVRFSRQVLQNFVNQVSGPAVLTGNTIIVKPSPFTPYTALKLAELAIPCFPPGVIQTLAGNDDLGPWMTTHRNIDKISFTGSTATGKKVAAVAAATMKRVTLELWVRSTETWAANWCSASGGNDPAIICSKVDITKGKMTSFCS